MPKHFLCLTLTLLALSLSAQKIPIKLSQWPDAPVAFEFPGKNRAILLFHDILRNEAVVRAVETDATFASLRQAEAPKVLRGELDSFAYIIGLHSDTSVTAYFIVDETDIWAYELRLSDFSLHNHKIITLTSKEYLLGGFVRDGKCGLLVRRPEKKNTGRLLLYEDLSGGLAPREIPLNGNLRLLNKLYRPTVAGSDIEVPPSRAAAADRICFGHDAVWFSADIPVKAPHGQVPAVELSALRWSDLSFHTDTLHYTDVPDGTYLPQKGAYALFDDKLFTLYLRDDVMSLRVRDLVTHSILWQNDLPADPNPVDFFSSPVVIPHGMPGPEILTNEQLIAFCLRYNPFLQVRQEKSGYLLAGGFWEGDNSGGVAWTGNDGSGRTPVVTAPSAGSAEWGNSRSFAASFYVALHEERLGADNNLRFSAGRPYASTLLGRIAEAMDDKAIRRNGGGVFYLFDRYFFGYYDPKEQGYFMNSLDLSHQ